MRVEVQDGKIVVTTENRNDIFNWGIRNLVSMDTGEKVRYSKAYPIGTVHATYATSEHDFGWVNGLIREAKACDIEVEQAVIDRRDELDRQRRELFEKEKREREEQRRTEHWKYAQKYGCGNCKKLRQDIDRFYCAGCGEELKTQVQRKFDGWTNTVYLFGIEPYPSEKCPLKG